MKNIFNIIICIGVLITLSACFKKSKPNYQYFPNMQKPVGYEAYQKSSAFPNDMEAQLPAEGSVARGKLPYYFLDTNEGYELAKQTLKNPLDSIWTPTDMTTGKKLYDIYCAVCHGNKGNGQGILAKREKFLGIPSYADREITEGSTYHVIIYGKNAMGSYANQLNERERWQVARYVMRLREDLKK